MSTGHFRQVTYFYSDVVIDDLLYYVCHTIGAEREAKSRLSVHTTATLSDTCYQTTREK